MAAAYGQAGSTVPPSAGRSITYIGANRSLRPLRARLPRQPLPGKTRALKTSAPGMRAGIFPSFVSTSETTGSPRSPHGS